MIVAKRNILTVATVSVGSSYGDAGNTTTGETTIDIRKLRYGQDSLEYSVDTTISEFNCFNNTVRFSFTTDADIGEYHVRIQRVGSANDFFYYGGINIVKENETIDIGDGTATDEYVAYNGIAVTHNGTIIVTV